MIRPKSRLRRAVEVECHSEGAQRPWNLADYGMPIKRQRLNKPVTLSLTKGLPSAVNSRAIQRARLPDQILRLAPLAQDDRNGRALRSG